MPSLFDGIRKQKVTMHQLHRNILHISIVYRQSKLTVFLTVKTIHCHTNNNKHVHMQTGRFEAAHGTIILSAACESLMSHGVQDLRNRSAS